MKPLALVSTDVPPIVVVLRAAPVAAELAPATAGPRSSSAMAAKAAVVNRAARAIAAGPWAGNVAGTFAAGATARASSTTNAATSTRPATMPAVVRISLNPDSPIQTDRR